MLFRTIIEGLNSVVFPHVCMMCGSTLSTNNNLLCSECLSAEFESVDNEEREEDDRLLLPEGISMRHALWQFDKGGKLQDVLHDLKYNRLSGLGIDIGRQLGRSLLSRNKFIPLIEGRKVRLLPVPLHPRKLRKRGYNQSFYIAKGFGEVTRLPIVSAEAVVRVKNTATQTGFSIQQRQENISKAFKVMDGRQIDGAVCVILDDVFTTGATTFELAMAVSGEGAEDIIIATVAEA